MPDPEVRMRKMVEALRGKQYRITPQRLDFFGICPDCQARQQS
jgi:Fe2+ or Zn2+ uptake regulation protein